MFATVLRARAAVGRRMASTSAYDELMKTLRNDLKKNIRLKADPLEKNVIRSILTEVKNMEIANRDVVQDEFQLHDLLTKMVKDREHSASVYMKEGSPDRFQQMGVNELREANFLGQYVDQLPLTPQSDVNAKVRDIVDILDKQGPIKSKQEIYKQIPWSKIQTEWKASKSQVNSAVDTVYIEYQEDNGQA